MRIKSVTPQQLNQWLMNDEAVLIDVREPAEFSSAHIQHATLLPLGQITQNDLPSTEKKVVIYCQKGARGNSACTKVTANDGDHVVYNLEGGIAAWQAEGLAVKKGDNKILPLDRQVQITIGTCVLAGSACAIWLNPMYAAVPAFFGAGLLFAGLSGTCGLAVVLAKMPWNQKV